MNKKKPQENRKNHYCTVNWVQTFAARGIRLFYSRSPPLSPVKHIALHMRTYVMDTKRAVGCIPCAITDAQQPSVIIILLLYLHEQEQRRSGRNVFGVLDADEVVDLRGETSVGQAQEETAKHGQVPAVYVNDTRRQKVTANPPHRRGRS